MARVLLVDDDSGAHDTLGPILRQAGHEFAGALTGTRGIQLAPEFDPDVAFLDGVTRDRGWPYAHGLGAFIEARRSIGMRHKEETVMRCSVLLVTLITAAAIGRVLAQQPPAAPAAPAFDAAAIKMNRSGSRLPGAFGPQPGGRWIMTNGSIRTLIGFAYVPGQAEILGLPDWVDSDRYDVTARAAERATVDELRQMARTLLADRFGFRMHSETRNRPTYALRRVRDDAGLGPQLRRVEGDLDCPALLAAVTAGTKLLAEVPVATNGPRRCTTQTSTRTSPTGSVAILRSGGNPFAALTAAVSRVVDRPVIDKTGLNGHYEFTLEYGARGASPDVSPASDATGIFTAIREQLGLKLDSEDNDVPVLVVDALERPSDD